MSDEKTITRIPLTDLPTGEIMVRANEALVLNELRNILTRQAERDIVIVEMGRAIDRLEARDAAQSEEIKALRHAHAVLLRQQAALHERQNTLAAVCDVFAKKLEDQTDQHEKLTKELGDHD